VVKGCDCKTSGKLRVEKTGNPKNPTQLSKLCGITPVFLTDFWSLQSGKNDIIESCGVLNPDCNKEEILKS
jgi:hypothetical protein